MTRYATTSRQRTKATLRRATRLGRAYRDGELGVAVDDAEARKWFQRAADLGDPGGALNLGALLMLGRGGPVDEAGALALYRRAAEQGSLAAEANIGGIYWTGAAGVEKNRTEAVKHYPAVAAEGGNVVAERMLSVVLTAPAMALDRDDAKQLDWAPQSG